MDAFATLELHFKHHPNQKYLVSDRVTLADIVLVANLSGSLRVSIDEASMLNANPKVKAYLSHLIAEPHVKSVLGEIKFLPTFTPPAGN